jgi:hypothetical protein
MILKTKTFFVSNDNDHEYVETLFVGLIALFEKKIVFSLIGTHVSVVLCI